MATHWQLIGDELATSWHLVGKALAHGTKADWANEGSHWRANEETFIGNSLAQSSDVIWRFNGDTLAIRWRLTDNTYIGNSLAIQWLHIGNSLAFI